jgi:pimeloyl-ACP methyl ester carboxylesterase
MLELVQALQTSGARAASHFSVGGNQFLAIAQLAEDIPGASAGMNLGDSDVSVIIYRMKASAAFEEWQRLSVPGGEDVEHFVIDGRHFLATASLRSGKGPYELDVSSVIFEWKEDKFIDFQRIPTFGAKQWRYFTLAGRHFLALAQGLMLPGVRARIPSESLIFEWNGAEFNPFQTIPSAWGYNWLHFSLAGEDFLAYADFRKPSILLRWDGDQFSHFQNFDGKAGRAFCFFRAGNEAYLAFADIVDDSILYRWDGGRFQIHQKLVGAGGREFALIESGEDIYLVLVRFITGNPQAPNTVLDSVLYRMEKGILKEVERFTTNGGTDVEVFSHNQETLLVVCESLTEEVRFRTDTKIFRFKPGLKDLGTIHGNAAYQSPELLALYHAYTGSSSGLGSKLVTAVSKKTTAFPLLVATSGDMIFFPGSGRDPSFVSYRLSNRGFKELAAVSHFGPALGSLVEIYATDTRDDAWRPEAETLLKATEAAQKANTPNLWRDKIRVKAYEGRENAIAAMIDYSCTITINYLKTILDDPTKLTPEFLQREYLEAKGDMLGATIPFNAVMIATFFLIGLDISYRMRIWLQDQMVNWESAMVLIVGRQGRETSGVTLSSNSVCQGILQSSNLELPVERIYIAPHGPTMTMTDQNDIEAMRKYETPCRSLWNKLYAIQSLGETMFAGYPRYKPQLSSRPMVTEETTQLSEMPQIRGPDDWLSLTTRMRLVLEDARQLLSGCVTDYAAEQIRLANNEPLKVVVPGLDDFDYLNGAKKPTAFETRNSQGNHTNAQMSIRLSTSPIDLQPQFFSPPTKFSVAGGEIAFYEEGVGDSIIIWLHGLPLDSRCWAAQRPYFRTRYRNIYMDLRGYGNSTKIPPEIKDVTQFYCDDLLSLIDFLNVKSANVVGFASAGHVALRFSAQHPERVNKLVTINASPCFRRRDDWSCGFTEEAIGKFVSAAENGGIEGITNMILDPDLVFRDLSRADAETLCPCFREMSLNAGLQTVLKFFNGISYDDDRQIMSNIKATTLLITGSLGQEVPSATGLFLRDTIQHSHLVEIPDADHFMFVTRPLIINPLIDGFLSS